MQERIEGADGSLAPEVLDLQGLGTGVEKETADTDLREKIAEPFDPEDIDVITRNTSVDLLLSRSRSKMIDFQPDFQRRWGVWDTRRQSRLIESMLLRIPLPVLYAAEDEYERWEIVDGIQRLSTIVRFIDSTVIESEPLVLSGLEYLTSYEGKTFEELSPRMKLRLRETELVIHLIRKGTPVEVKFNIFARINTGGMALSAQELRHAITPGPARTILADWATNDAFRQATDYSVRDVRMDDRELILRFLAFYLLGVQQYKQPDMDGFLIKAMKTLNGLSNSDIERAKGAFDSAMQSAYAIFANDSFRKRYSQNVGRFPINKAIFEAISVTLANLPSGTIGVLVSKKEEVRSNFIRLCNDREFEASISQGTGDVTKVARRFQSIEHLFERTYGNA